MPTYEYRCPNGHEFERFFRSMSSAQAATTVVCPVCGVVALRELSSSAGLMFKGSGFYLTDYGKNAHGKKGPPSTAGAEGGSSGASESGGESGGGGSDAKGSSSESAASGGDSKSPAGDTSPTGSAAKKADKPAAPASKPNKPSSGKQGE